MRWHINVKTGRELCCLFHLNIVHFELVESLKMKCAKLFSLLFHSAFSFLLQLKQCLLKGKLASLFTLHSNDVLLWKSRCSNEDAALFMSFEYCPPHTACSLWKWNIFSIFILISPQNADSSVKMKMLIRLLHFIFFPQIHVDNHNAFAELDFNFQVYVCIILIKSLTGFHKIPAVDIKWGTK